MIGIYKITNKVNQKSYIGQSIHIERRWSEHCFPSKTSKISLAIKEYGKENFNFEILEECLPEQLNEKEEFYIKKYNTIIPNGYNATDYIDGNVTNYFFHTKENIKQIQNLLLNSQLSLTEIAQKCNINISNVSRINKGITHYNKNFQYPLRNTDQNHHYCQKCGKQLTSNAQFCIKCYKENSLENMLVSREELKDLIRNKPFLQIGKQFGVSDNAVKKWCIKYNLPSKKKDINQYSNEEWAQI